MNRDYEQLNTGTSDNLGNPFSRTRKGGFNEIMRNKNRYGKYIFIFVACLFILLTISFFVCLFGCGCSYVMLKFPGQVLNLCHTAATQAAAVTTLDP